MSFYAEVMMNDSTSLEHLLSVLSLRSDDSTNGTVRLHGESLYFPTGRVYGGQVIAQSLMAAAASVPEDRLPHSVHGYFIAPGDIHEDVTFSVETLRDGKSFSARRVNATQSHGPILTAIASYQVAGQSGVEFQDPAPTNVPDPETLANTRELMAPYAPKSPFADYYVTKSPFDIRHVTRTVMLAPDTDSAAQGSGTQLVWMRLEAPEQIGQDLGQLKHRAILALGCDQIMMEPVLRRAGLSFMTPGISYATIDHAMWWYGDLDVTRWHLYVQDTPVAGRGRGLAHAKVYQDGRLVAALSQEAMVRVRSTQTK